MAFVLDVRGIESEAELQDAMAALLDFPEYYRREADALWVCLTNLKPTTLIVMNCPEPGAPMRAMVDSYLGIMRDYQEESPGRFSLIVT